MSDPLTGKQILAGAVLDAGDTTINTTGEDSSEVLLLGKAAALHADPDLADTAQRLVAYWDTMSGLPIAADAGVVALSVNNGADRLIRL